MTGSESMAKFKQQEMVKFMITFFVLLTAMMIIGYLFFRK